MGLAERFKTQLNSKDIFQKAEVVEDLMDGIKFISTPVKENVETKIQHDDTKEIAGVSGVNDNKIEQVTSSYNPAKFEELETDIINKIRKTPYWEDYSRKRQECMISKYFDVKIQKRKYSQDTYSIEDKNEFIQNILTLSNNR